MKKVYLAHQISTRGEFEDSKRVADEIRALGFECYAAAENASINDKRNEPNPIDIYNGDVDEIIDCDIFVVNLSDGHGTISEVGVVAGLNEGAKWAKSAGHPADYKPIIAYTSNARLLQPQFHEGIPSASANHLVLGMIDRWGKFLGDEASMLAHLKEEYSSL